MVRCSCDPCPLFCLARFNICCINFDTRLSWWPLARQPRPQLRTDDAGANPWGAHTETCRILSDPEMQADEGSTMIYGIYVFQFSGKKALTCWAWNAPTDSSWDFLRFSIFFRITATKNLEHFPVTQGPEAMRRAESWREHAVLQMELGVNLAREQCRSGMEALLPARVFLPAHASSNHQSSSTQRSGNTQVYCSLSI